MGTAGVLTLPQAKVVGSEIFQIIRNAGFENSCTADDWVDPTRTTDEANSGSYSAKIRIGYFEDFQQTLLSGVKVNDVESFTFYIKGANGLAAVNVDAYYTDETHSTHQFNGATDWTQRTITGMTSGKTIEYIKFRAIQSGYVVYIDDVSLIAPLAQEIILNINIHLGCTNEVSSFEIVIDRGNPDYGYDALLNPGDEHSLDTGMDLELYLGRPDEEGVSPSLLLTGQIDEIEYIDELEEYQFRNVVIVRGRCNGYQLFGRHLDGDLISFVGNSGTNYNRTFGDASSMIAYLIDNKTDLSHVRVNGLMSANANSLQKVVQVVDGSVFTPEQLVKIQDDNGWEYNRIGGIVDNTLTMYNNLVNSYTTAANGKVWIDLIENTGDSDAVAPTAFTELIYENTIVFDIIKHIAEVADLDGVIGYDTRIEYDGKFAFFSKGSKLESYSLQDECQMNRYLKDANRIKNKVTVYGKAEKPYPLTAANQPFGNTTPYDDTWTEYVDPSINSLLTANANSGQNVVSVTDGTKFAVNDYVRLIDTNNNEEAQIASISTNDLTMVDNLTNTYTTAANATCLKLIGWYSGTGTGIVRAEGTVKMEGNYSVEHETTSGDNYGLAVLYLKSGSYANMDEYGEIKFFIYLGSSNFDKQISVVLYDDSDKTATKSFTMSNTLKWENFSVQGNSTDHSFDNVDSGFNWGDIVQILIYATFTGSSTGKFYIDRLHFTGKRWGGGSDDAAVDGYAENASSITTYGTRELKIISDLLLSDKECELKAQSLIDFYSSERLVIEVASENIDWATYNPMAGNKVAVDLDELGVTGSTYRIDSIDINFRGADNSLSAVFTLDDTPMKLADYLYKMSERLRNLERNYEKIR